MPPLQLTSDQPGFDRLAHSDNLGKEGNGVRLLYSFERAEINMDEQDILIQYPGSSGAIMKVGRAGWKPATQHNVGKEMGYRSLERLKKPYHTIPISIKQSNKKSSLQLLAASF